MISLEIFPCVTGHILDDILPSNRAVNTFRLLFRQTQTLLILTIMRGKVIRMVVVVVRFLNDIVFLILRVFVIQKF